MNERHSPDWLVVVGSSAGGIESLSKLVTTLPENFPAPVIVAQHLHPERASHLQEILQARTPLPVYVIEGRLDLKPGSIYIAGPNTHVEITDRDVHEADDAGERPMPSIDLLFETATHTFSERTIAVILSGTGSDGTAGARAVKDAGGIVIIENPQTSAFPQMALSLPPTIVDIVTDLDSIGTLLHDLVTGVYEIDTRGQQSQLDWLLSELRQRSGIDFAQYKSPTIMRRIQRRMVATDNHDLAGYISYLRSNPDEYDILASSFLVKVTEFFRDPELFDHLLNGGIQPIIDRAIETGELRIWSAGCATGEEAYSLAIVVSELLGDQLTRLNVRIFGTDIDAEAIAYARQGIYPASSLSNLSGELIERYFTPREGFYEVRKSIRSLVVFGQHDLGQRSPFPRIDLALCRNVLIYFTNELQRRALQLFAFALRDGGLLLLGKAETVTPFSEYFSLVDSRLKIYQRVGNHVLIPPGRFHDLVPPSVRSDTVPTRTPMPRAPQPGRRGSHRMRTERFGDFEEVLGALPVGITLVDRDYQIAYINPRARQHLGVHTVAVDDDLMHVAQNPPLTMLRNAVDSAFRGEPSAETYEISITRDDGGEDHTHLELYCFPFNGGEEAAEIEHVVIQTTDVTDLVTIREQLNETSERLQRVMNAQRSLEIANDRLTEANQQLHANNEELLISNEEFQAAAEEVETLNEELQATNEELETLNEELQATIEELNTTNEDLQARNREMEHLAKSSEEQRQRALVEQARLEAVLASMTEAVMLVDEQGTPIITNAAFNDIFGQDSARLRPEDAEGQPLEPSEWPQHRAARGESFTMRFTMVTEGERRTFQATGRPVSEDTVVRGGVVTIRSVPDR